MSLGSPPSPCNSQSIPKRALNQPRMRNQRPNGPHQRQTVFNGWSPNFVSTEWSLGRATFGPSHTQPPNWRSQLCDRVFIECESNFVNPKIGHFRKTLAGRPSRNRQSPPDCTIEVSKTGQYRLPTLRWCFKPRKVATSLMVLSGSDTK